MLCPYAWLEGIQRSRLARACDLQRDPVRGQASCQGSAPCPAAGCSLRTGRCREKQTNVNRRYSPVGLTQRDYEYTTLGNQVASRGNSASAPSISICSTMNGITPR